MPSKSTSEMTGLYKDFFAANSNADFDEADVPTEYRDLSLYARFWGVGDDWIREELVAKAPPNVRRELAMAVLGRHLSMLVTWLGGHESKGPTFSKAYIAYTNLIMAAEDAHFREKRAGWDWKPSTYSQPSES